MLRKDSSHNMEIQDRSHHSQDHIRRSPSRPSHRSPSRRPSRGGPNVLAVTAVKDVTNRAASKTASAFFILLDGCFNIYSTPVSISTIYHFR